MKEVYVSTDIETDGPLPGRHSMLSLASAAFAPDGTVVDTYTVNLEALPEATEDPHTMKFWARYPEAWAACRTDLREPAEALPAYARWLEQLPARPVFVAWPAGFDFTFVQYYLGRFHGSSPFGFAALDMKSYAMALTGRRFRATTKQGLPDHWLSDRPHTHIALDDALEQGEIFLKMLADRGPSRDRDRTVHDS